MPTDEVLFAQSLKRVSLHSHDWLVVRSLNMIGIVGQTTQAWDATTVVV